MQMILQHLSRSQSRQMLMRGPAVQPLRMKMLQLRLSQRMMSAWQVSCLSLGHPKMSFGLTGIHHVDAKWMLMRMAERKV